MAKIINKNNNKIIVNCDKSEYQSLQGRYKTTYFFHDRMEGKKAELFRTGVNRSLMFFKIPGQWVVNRSKKRVKQRLPVISCQRMDLPDKVVLIYSVNFSKV